MKFNKKQNKKILHHVHMHHYHKFIRRQKYWRINYKKYVKTDMAHLLSRAFSLNSSTTRWKSVTVNRPYSLSSKIILLRNIRNLHKLADKKNILWRSRNNEICQCGIRLLPVLVGKPEQKNMNHRSKRVLRRSNLGTTTTMVIKVSESVINWFFFTRSSRDRISKEPLYEVDLILIE